MKLITEIWSGNDDSEMTNLEAVIKSKSVVQNTQRKSANKTERLSADRRKTVQSNQVQLFRRLTYFLKK